MSTSTPDRTGYHPSSSRCGSAVPDGALIQLRSSRQSRDITIVEVAGEIDRPDAEAVGAQAIQLLSSARSVIVDLTDVQFLGASALRAFVEIHAAAAAQDAQFRLVTPPWNRAVRRPIELTNLEAKLMLHSTVDEALATLVLPRGDGDAGEVACGPVVDPVSARQRQRLRPAATEPSATLAPLSLPIEAKSGPDLGS